MQGSKRGTLWFSVVVLLGLVGALSALAEEQPRYGGILNVALAGDPPSLDMHQESTFMVQIPIASVYNTLVQFDPHGYPTIIGDLAKSWTVSDDHLSYTFKLHEGVKFHDGTELTAADVKASWDRIVFQPEGVVSPRQSLYTAVKSIEAPDRSTVVSPSTIRRHRSWRWWPAPSAGFWPKNISIRINSTIAQTASALDRSS